MELLKGRSKYPIVAAGLAASYLLASLLNHGVVSITSRIFRSNIEEYLWVQFHAMGFAFLYTLYIFFVLAYIGVAKRKEDIHSKDPDPRETPMVSLVIPAYNEEENIGKVLQNIMNIDYPKDKLEVIVVDDGSEDDTYHIAKRYPVRVVRHEENKGRGAAVETGISLATGDYIVTIDSDTLLARDSIKKIVSYMERQPNIGAACGRLRPTRTSGPLGIGQKVEYLLGYAFAKKLKSALGWMLIPSGAFSIYRRRVVADAHISNTMAEDFDLGLHVIRKGYRLGYVEEALAETDNPSTLRSFIRQRVRWNVGGLQVLAKHSDMMFNPHYEDIGLLALPLHLFLGFIAMLMEAYGLGFILTLNIIGIMPWTSLAVLGTWLALLKLSSIILLIPGYIYGKKKLGEQLKLHELLYYWTAYYYLLLYTGVRGSLVYLKQGITNW